MIVEHIPVAFTSRTRARPLRQSNLCYRKKRSQESHFCVATHSDLRSAESCVPIQDKRSRPLWQNLIRNLRLHSFEISCLHILRLRTMKTPHYWVRNPSAKHFQWRRLKIKTQLLRWDWLNKKQFNIGNRRLRRMRGHGMRTIGTCNDHPLIKNCFWSGCQFALLVCLTSFELSRPNPYYYGTWRGPSSRPTIIYRDVDDPRVELYTFLWVS